MKNVHLSIGLYLVIALFASSPSYATEWSIEAHLFTQHFVNLGPVDTNEKNWGGGLRYQFSENWAILAGVYRNSITSHEFRCNGSVCSWEIDYQDSHYVSFERSIKDADRYQFGFGIGVADGYKGFTDENGVRYQKGSDYNLLAGPYLNIGNQYSIKFRYMFELASMSVQYKF